MNESRKKVPNYETNKLNNVWKKYKKNNEWIKKDRTKLWNKQTNKRTLKIEESRKKEQKY